MDVGSNAFRLAIAEFTSPTRYRILEKVRIPVRLGESVFHTHRIDPGTMDAALEAFRSFRRTMESHGVVVHRAVATSAPREAKNRAAFIERVHTETGIDLELIKGAEEARLVALGVRAKIALARGLSVILDVGGGSSEIAVIAHGEILLVESHDVGGIRLLERVGSPPPGRMLPLVHTALRAARFPVLDSIGKRRVTRFIGTGGNIETLATLFGTGGSGRNGGGGRPWGGSRGRGRWAGGAGASGVARITLPRLRAALTALARLEPAERARVHGLRPDRADVIVPAGAVFEFVGTRIGAREVIVPFVGLVDGVLIDVAQTVGKEGEKAIEVAQTRNASLAVMRKYDVDVKHALRVASLACSLFDQLRPQHGLPKRDRLLLELAARLHEVGQFINSSGHHRHAYYILTETPILGLTDVELAVVGNVARYHRKAPPDLSHECYRDLAVRDRQRVRALAAILRVADGLDHDHRQRVVAVKAKPRGSELRLLLRTRGDVTLDELSVGEKGDLFQEEFGLRPVVKAAS
jgi:exopolyphosphatase/guanosine-5'-triphosphate,3'-diphosphate pyrophosphatase